MKLWPLILLLLLFRQPELRGQGVEDLMKSGEQALADRLWEIAEPRFRQALAYPDLSPELRARATVRLAEALIREGNPNEALELLDRSSTSSSPEVPFWKGQALTAQNRFSEAIAIFSKILEHAADPHRTEAGLTAASLQLSLEQPEAALDTLANLLAGLTDSPVRILLYQVEILLDLGRLSDARRAMPDNESIDAQNASLASFLEAQLQLREGHPDVAEAAFRVLLSHSAAGLFEGLSEEKEQLAAIGLADAIDATDGPESASLSLLDYIQEHPDSPILDTMFSRLLRWLPEKLTVTDPTLERIDQWIPIKAPRLLAVVPGAIGPDPISAWPAAPESRENKSLIAWSLFLRGVGLHRIATPETKVEARRQLDRLRLEFPSNPLADRALFELARWNLADGKADLAFASLETLRESSVSPTLKGQSAFVEARAAYQDGDLEKAIRLFDEAGNQLAGPDARVAKLQESIARIQAGESSVTTLIQNQAKTLDPELAADLKLEKALSTTPPAAARAALDEFLTHHPDHPRASEARLAAAESALASPVPDLSFATAQLDALAADPEKAADLPPARLALARLRILDLSHDTAATIAAAQAIVDTYPGQSEAAEAAFTLGSTLFQTGSYNPALLVLKKLAASDADTDRIQAAWLLAARAAALGGTESSKKEALGLFDSAIGIGGPLTAIASLEKARHLIDLSRPDEAAGFLRQWIAKLSEKDPLQLPAGLLLGEALFSQGSSNPASLGDALAIYHKLLDRDDTPPALFYRLKYLCGKTLELMPDPKDSAKTREKEAFQAYHSVLETTTTPTEWEYFERCGFRALELLEKAQRWQAAINVARKIASFGGPRAEEAAARANEIHLRQQVWEE